ncbi:hypothetical protein PR001_g12171 [Phytophthora rubi]|uniref:Uncharacterized protein n=1 Tax=Phytophthora rubi TaxID=129364 RepID=A0A6A3M3T9_9STRA|nr:hypothetical protein PR001_g12171 [Phytophthora rubi]
MVRAEPLGLAAAHAAFNLAAVAPTVRPAENTATLRALRTPNVVATTTTSMSTTQPAAH